MNSTRRSFLGGALAMGAFAGCRAFRAPNGLFAGDGAKLVLGVVSDIHIDAAKGDFRKFGDAAQFERTLHWFDDQGVDGVIVAGDMADNGMINQLECVGAAWFRVFPNSRSRLDGRKVEQLFVYGNHDFEGHNYDKFEFRYFEKKSFEAALIRNDPAAAWKHVFHEEYAPIWFKTVKGYQFVGAHWSLGNDPWGGIPEVETWFREHADKLNRTKPFFFIQHCHPKDTVYGSEAWCPDKGYATRALTPFSNAIAFSGHSHCSLTDERSIWQGAFTSIGTASLRYGGDVDRYEQRQGQLVRVYDDRIVIERRDFLHDLPLAEDWVIPLPMATDKPYAFESRRKKSTPPQFAAEAKLSVVREADGWCLTFPCANAARTRPFRYEISYAMPAGCKLEKGQLNVFLAYDAKYNMPRSMVGAPTVHRIKDEQLPKGPDGARLKPNFTVTPMDAFGNRGRTIGA